MTVDWRSWHEAYENRDSGLSLRLALVQAQVRAALDRLPDGSARAISVCAGQGHDLIGALADHPQGAAVSARLVELEEGNVRLAQEAARAAGLDGLEVLADDASVTDAYVGAVPANVVLLCGVFGNLHDADIERSIAMLPQLCARDATVIWTRHRLQPDITPSIRSWFSELAFEELAFEVERTGRFAVGAARFAGAPVPLRTGERLFTFVDGLWTHRLDG